MIKKADIGQNAKVLIKWNVFQSDYSREQEKNLITLMSQKYGIPAKNIKIEPNYVNADAANGLLSGVESVQSIHDPKFQQELMKKYIEVNGIKDIDFDEIVKIDSQINALIDYDSYGKSKRYSIKWVKWSNFLSYGPDNYFDFTTLHGLVLLNGEPANKSGKSTFAYDLLHFLLFGKTNTNKAKTMGDLFNNYLPDERTLSVEGCISIDGEDYIIRRTLTRPAAGKKTKTVTNKVEYFKLMGDGTEEALPDNNEQGATTTATSQIIKDALGNESDFDLIISANAKDLDSLISLTETEKGRLLARWIGLSVIEDKDAKAREKWNKEISVGRFSDMYNRAQLETEISGLTERNNEISQAIKDNEGVIADADSNIKKYNETRDALLLSKTQIDENVLKTDVQTLETSIKTIVEDGKRKGAELKKLQEDLQNFGDITYSEEEYRNLGQENNKLVSDMAEARTNITNLKNTNAALASAEFCPTCHRRFDNVDNTKQIEENNTKIKTLTEKGIAMKKRSDEIVAKMGQIDIKRQEATNKSKLELKIATLNTTLASQRLEYKEKTQLMAEIEKNKAAIAKNSEIDAKINVVDANIKAERDKRKAAEDDNKDFASETVRNNQNIATKKSYIVKIDEEQKIEKHWKLYLAMIGKDGISKMVLKNSLPVINAELNRLLSDVTDFRVEVTMNDKNDIDFLLIRDDVITRLSAASGLEKTQASLALRVVLGKMSRLSKPPFILLDEVLGTVARENYDDMKKLYDKIVEYFDFILHITHLADITDWHDSIVTVQKIDNISRIK